MVSHPLRMRKALGSNPSVSIFHVHTYSFDYIRYKIRKIIPKFHNWPVGLMDKASAPGAGDSRFESWAGHGPYLHLVPFRNGRASVLLRGGSFAPSVSRRLVL